MYCYYPVTVFPVTATKCLLPGLISLIGMQNYVSDNYTN